MHISIDLYDFFHSVGCKRWLGIILRSDHVQLDGRYVYVEESYLQNVYQYLVREKAFRARAVDYEHSGPTNWVLDMIDSPWKLKEIVGKSAAELWLYENRPLRTVRYAFWLSLKHYCERNRRSMDSVSDLQDLASSDFSCIRAWLNQGQLNPVQKLGLGVAYYNLRLWSKAVQHLKADAKSENEAPAHSRSYDEMLVSACIEINDLDEAIAVFGNGEADGQWTKVVLALTDYGIWENASHILESQEVEAEHVMLVGLYRLKIALARHDYQNAIEYYQNEVKHSSDYKRDWWKLQCLEDLYESTGEASAEVKVYRRAVENGQVKSRVGGLRNTKLDENGPDYSTNLTPPTKQGTSERIAPATPNRQRGDAAQLRGPPSVQPEPSVREGSLEILSTEPQPWQITKDWAGVWCVILNRNLKRQICVSHLHTIERLGIVQCATFSKDGNFIAIGGYRSAQIFHAKIGSKIATFEDSDIFSQDCVTAIREKLCANRVVRFSPDAKLLLSAGDDGTIKIWDVQLKSLKLQLIKHTAAIHALDVSPDGAYLVSGSSDGTIILWDYHRATDLRKLEMDDVFEVSFLSFSSDATFIAASFTGENSSEPSPVILWNRDGAIVARFGTDHANEVVGFSPKGDKLFASGPNTSYGWINMWESGVGQGIDSEMSDDASAWKRTSSGVYSGWVGSGVWEVDGLYGILEGGDDFHVWNVSDDDVLFGGENDCISTYFPDYNINEPVDVRAQGPVVDGGLLAIGNAGEWNEGIRILSYRLL